MKKRIISLLLTFAVLFSILPVTAKAHPAGVCLLSVESVGGTPGSVVDVSIFVHNNPGIIGALVKLKWEGNLTLTDCANGEAWSELSFTPPAEKTSGCNFVWYSSDVRQVRDGRILRLSFKIPEDARENERYTLTLECKNEDMIDRNLNAVVCAAENGAIHIFDNQPGDLNGDRNVNSLDMVLLSRYISDNCMTNPNGYNVIVNDNAANVNNDGKINSVDLILLSRYLADGGKTNPNGYNIKLLYPIIGHVHEMVELPYKEANCTEDGNINCWFCTECGKYYNNAEGSKELTQEQTVLKALGHDAVVIPGREPTATEVGYTEGMKCARCGTILVEPIEIPIPGPCEYPIRYHVSNGDTYLQSVNADEKNPNPSVYSSGTGLVLQDMDIPGYRFLGWYDGQTEESAKITQIPAGHTGNIELYARWNPIRYTVLFDSPDVPVDSISYTVNKGTILPQLQHFGYEFLGWSIGGQLVSEIKPGTLPDNGSEILVHANWTSCRNLAKPVEKLAPPMIVEDIDNSIYLFLYKLGTIENVPINSRAENNFGYLESISIGNSFEISTGVQKTMAENAALTVSNATTRSPGWFLGSEWNRYCTAAEKIPGEGSGMIVPDGDESKWYISSDCSHTASVAKVNGISAKITNGESTGISGTYCRQWGDVTSHSTEILVQAGAKKSGENADAGYDYSYVNPGQDNRFSVGSLNSYISRNSGGIFTGTPSANIRWGVNNSIASRWNSAPSYGRGKIESNNYSVSNAISDKLFSNDHISSMIKRQAGNSTLVSDYEHDPSASEYFSVVEYSTEESKTISLSRNFTSNQIGYYRLVTAGTIHVYAVVGYDIATNSYFTYTYNILDANERHPYLDYSMSNSNFNDCENGVLPFDVPYEVQEFIGDKLARSEGLDISLSTGKVNGYTGSEEYVVLPEYLSVDNHNGTFSAVKVTGIEPGVFKGNKNLRGVYFPKYVSSIPDNAFEGCTALNALVGRGLTAIGNRAFIGCTSINCFTVDHLIEHMGTNAFENVGSLEITASCAAVADASFSSGANGLTLNLQQMSDPFNNRKIVIPEQCGSFRLLDNGSVRENLQIESHANLTELNNLNLLGRDGVPLKLYSPNLKLTGINVEASSGLAMALFANQTNIELSGDNMLRSAGKYVLLARKLALFSKDSGDYVKLTAVPTSLLCDPDILNAELFSGTIQKIRAEEFDYYLNVN